MIDLTPALRIYARYRLARLARRSPDRAQREQLGGLLRTARDTRFGRSHEFEGIDGVEAFQAAVPLRSYEDFWEGWWREPYPDLEGATWPERIPYFALTSGTSTGGTKRIPVSRDMIRSNSKAGFDVLVHHINNCPQSHVFAGKSFMLSGAVPMTREGAGVHSGDLTGIASRELPAIARALTFPPSSLRPAGDWEQRIAAIGRASLKEDIRTIAGTPSWLLLFFEMLAEIAPGPQRLSRLYPNLELLVHGGVDFTPYRSRFDDWLQGSRAELREVYPASEGFFAAADRGDGEGLRLNTDNGIFYEFVPVEDLDAAAPRRHWVGNAETGRDYALVVSTCAGLWAYRVGDVVRLVDLDPPRLLVTGRVSYFLSAFGEHLSGEEIAESVAAAAGAVGADVAEFSVGPVFEATGRSRGGHLYVVELADPQALAGDWPRRFAEALDLALRNTNDDYDTYRSGDQRLRPPEVLFVEPGTFVEWMRAQGRIGGQNKVPRVVADPDRLEELRRFAAGRRVGPAG